MVRIVMGFYFTLRLLQMIIPWVLRSIGFTLKLMLTAISSLWVGVPQATHRIADEWIDRAVAAGFPTIWDRKLYYTIRIVAFITIVVGWVLLSFVTVWIVKLIF